MHNVHSSWSTFQVSPVYSTKILPLLKNVFRLLSASSGVAYAHICKVLISQNFHSFKRLSSSIINDPLHPFHPYLANALPTSTTRSSFKLLRCRTLSSLFWSIILQIRNKRLVLYLPIFPKEHSLYLIIC